MSDIDGKEHELLLKQITRKFMENRLNELKDDKQETNNSFVFLDNSTLNMLILYLLMNGKSRTTEKVSDESQGKIVGELEHLLADSKKDFEEILAILYKMKY